MVANITTKPFNPLLGETYEFQNNNIHSISEQVSHHPPVTANYCSGIKENFRIMNSIETKTKFKGTYMDFIDNYKGYIEFPDFNEKYEMVNPVVSAHNLIVGTLYIDIGGESTVTPLRDHTLMCIIKWTKRSWFSSD